MCPARPSRHGEISRVPSRKFVQRATRALCGAVMVAATASHADSTPTVEPLSAAYRPNSIFSFDVPKLAQSIR